MRHSVCLAAVLVLLPSFALAQEKTVPTPPNVKVEGMPPIPQSILDGLSKYAQYRQATLTAWVPQKRQILVTTAFNPASPQIHLVEGPGRDRRQLTWMDRLSTSVTASFDPADPDTFVFPYDASAELRSIYRYKFSTGESALVTTARMRYTPRWSKQGKWLAYDSAERNGRDRDLYVIQPADPSTKRRLADFTGAFSPEDWSSDGSTILALEIPSNAETYLWRVDVKTGAQTAITPRDGEKAAWYNPRFSTDGKRIYALSDRAGGDWRIWRCDLPNCAWTPVTGEGVLVDFSAGGFDLSPDGTQLATAINKGSYSELQIVDLTTLKARPMTGVPKGTISQIKWRPASREVAFTLGSVKSSGDVYSVDVSLGTMSRWTTSETTFNADALPAPEVVEWKSFDGLMISGIYYRPASRFTGPRPVIVNIHGGPDGVERARWQGRSNYFLNELGMAIIFPNVRGSIGFGRTFAQLDDGKLRVNAVKDIGALLDWIATRPELNRNRVVLLGASSGGWLALQAGVAYNDRIRGVVEAAGITNFVTFLEGTDPPRQANRRQEYGDERDPEMREFLLSLSPVTHAAELKKPTLIVHPGKDPRVPVSQAQDLVKALKTNNQNVWYLEVTEANHDNLFAFAYDYQLSSSIWFFQNFVLNDTPRTTAVR